MTGEEGDGRRAVGATEAARGGVERAVDRASIKAETS
jgi:hypothetical protein